MPSWTDEYAQMLKDCVRRQSKLTEWDRGFLDSLVHEIEDHGTPTPRQCEVLDKIWDRVTA